MNTSRVSGLFWEVPLALRLETSKSALAENAGHSVPALDRECAAMYQRGNNVRIKSHHRDSVMRSLSTV